MWAWSMNHPWASIAMHWDSQDRWAMTVTYQQLTHYSQRKKSALRSHAETGCIPIMFCLSTAHKSQNTRSWSHSSTWLAARPTACLQSPYSKHNFLLNVVEQMLDWSLTSKWVFGNVKIWQQDYRGTIICVAVSLGSAHWCAHILLSPPFNLFSFQRTFPWESAPRPASL